METSKCILARRSVRKYSNCEISDSELEKIITSGIYAPSAKNRQPWHFYIINDKKTKLSIVNNMKQGMETLYKKYLARNIVRSEILNAKNSLVSMKESSAIIFIACEKKYKQSYDDGVNWYMSATDMEVTDVLSIGAAIQNILLTATELGYGTLWICDIFYSYPEIIEFLNTDYAILSAICICKSKKKTKRTSRNSYKSVTTFIRKD